jgi:type VI secretion system protein ImpK
VLRLGAAAAVVLAFVMLLDVWQDRDTPAPEPRAVPSSVTPSADPLAHLNLGIRGTHVERRPGEIAVTFDDGLFRRDANLTPRGRAVLEDLGERLRPYGNQITVAVLGHTDRKAVHPGGGYASNAELGLLRATVVREVLRSSARIPTSRFSVSTLAALLPPHSGKADVRNRTVSLRISSAGGR